MSVFTLLGIIVPAWNNRTDRSHVNPLLFNFIIALELLYWKIREGWASEGIKTIALWANLFLRFEFPAVGRHHQFSLSKLEDHSICYQIKAIWHVRSIRHVQSIQHGYDRSGVRDHAMSIRHSKKSLKRATAWTGSREHRSILIQKIVAPMGLIT